MKIKNKTFSALAVSLVAGSMNASGALTVIAGWDTWTSTSSDATVVASGVTETLANTTEQLAWNIVDERGASSDGTWGTFAGGPAADTIVGTADNQNLELPNATTGGTLTLTITNGGADAIELNAFHFDSYAFRPKAARAYVLSVASGDITNGVIYTSGDDEITHVGGANSNTAHDQIDHVLTGLGDNVLAPGESAAFLLAFSSGVGDGAGGHDLWVDNIAVSGEILSVPEPSSALLLGLSGLALIARRRK
ncbi:PEP-CTERM sorting domain-containing protein [Akkermansiaceae bacterium]|nr:PEP-CTERM sorting domain-containing protein [Akkermansiaceae bacterium]